MRRSLLVSRWLVCLVGALSVASASADTAGDPAMKQLNDMLDDASALLQHGSNKAQENAAAQIAALAIETTISQPFHPLTFRNACVQKNVVPYLVKLLDLDAKATAAAQHHALRALEAIATDDPATDLDNDHARVVCQAGTVPRVVRLLESSDEHLQLAATSCLAVLAESEACRGVLDAHTVVEPLVALATYGNDAVKMHAVAALDQISLNNRGVKQKIVGSGGLELLQGLRKYGGMHMRSTTSEMVEGLEEAPSAQQIAVDAKAHARMAHETRIKHSKIWEMATGMPRAYSGGSATVNE